jgi:hypothetical protein
VRIQGAIFSATCRAMALRHKLQKCLHGATLTQVAAIVAKSRNEFYFSQRLLQLKLVSQHFFKLRRRLHAAMLRAYCVATPLREKLQRKLHRGIAPLALTKFKGEASELLQVPSPLKAEKLSMVLVHWYGKVGIF